MAAEFVEGRVLTEGNANERSRVQTQCWNNTMSRLARVQEAASKDRKQTFTALLHHVTPELLESSFYSLKKRAASGVDGVTWRDYSENLKDKIVDLYKRIHNGAYRPKPSRQVHIPKSDGTERALSIQCIEDKIAQQAIVTVLNQIYENDFKGFSYGFRPNRSQHDALDALTCGIVRKKVNWVLDLDIRKFFDTVEHEWLLRMLGHRIQDKCLLKLISRWMKVGIVDGDGKRNAALVGVPQGAVISPLLSNIYLHYVFDLWSERWRTRKASGDVIIIRYADDAVLGFQDKQEADEFRVGLDNRLRQFGLTLHPDKTRLIQFGRFAQERCANRGSKPLTFDFLGFTHYCTTRRNGSFRVGRKTSRKKIALQIAAVQSSLRQKMHQPPVDTVRWLCSVMRGHMNYYSVPGNISRVSLFRTEIIRRWFKMLRRRSQRNVIVWSWFSSWINSHLPHAKVVHPYPEERFLAKYSQ